MVIKYYIKNVGYILDIHYVNQDKNVMHNIQYINMTINITLCKRYEWRGAESWVSEKIKIEIEFLNRNLNLSHHIGYPPPMTK